MAIVEGLAISLAIEVGSRGYDWAKQSFGEDNAPIRAAQVVAERHKEEGLIEDDFQIVFGQVFTEDELNTARSADKNRVVARLAEGFDEYTGGEIDVASEVIANEYVDQLERELARELTEGLDIVVDYLQTLEDSQEDLLSEVQRLKAELEPNVQELIRRTKQNLESDRLEGYEGNLRDRQGPDDIGTPDVQRVIDNLDDGHSVIVTGPAGSGKSGVLRTVARRHRDEGLVYFLDARELTGISRLGEISDEYGLRRPISAILDRLSDEFGQCLFVMDQLDNVRGGNAGKKVREVLHRVDNLDDVQVLCACRTWDIEERNTFNSLVDSFVRCELKPLPKDLVREVLIDIGVPQAEISSALVGLGQNLLNLSLIDEILHSNEDVVIGEIGTAVQLWDKYTETLATREGETSPEYDQGAIDECVTYATKAYESASESFIATDDEYAERIRSRGTIVSVDPDSEYSQRYRFFHDELRGYFYARKLAGEHCIRVTAISDGKIDDGIDERIARGAFEWLVRMYAHDSRERLHRLASTALSNGDHAASYTTAVAILDELLAVNVDNDPELVDIVRDTVRHRAELASRLADPSTQSVHPSWARALGDPEFIMENPSLAGVVSATAETDPNVAINVIQRWDHTDPKVAPHLIDVLRALSPKQITAYLDEINNSLVIPWDSEAEHDLSLLVESLVAREAYNAALPLLTALLEPPQDVSFEPLCDPDIETRLDFELRSGYRSVLNAHDMETLRRTLSVLAQERGPETAEIFQREIDLLLERTHSGSQPVSWSVSCSDSIGDLSLRNCETYLQRLLVMLRDVSDQWFKVATGNDRAEAEQFVDSLLSSEPPLRSLGWYLLRQQFTIDSDRVLDELTSPERYPQTTCAVTFLELLHEAFQALDRTDRLAVEHAVLRAPAERDLSPIRDELDMAPIGSDAYPELWLYRYLEPIRPQLSETTRKILDDLSKHPNIAAREVLFQRFKPSRSSRSYEDTSGANFNREDLTERLRSFEADEMPGVIREMADEDGSISYPLRNALSDLVSDSPSEYGSVYGSITTFPAVVVDELLSSVTGDVDSITLRSLPLEELLMELDQIVKNHDKWPAETRFWALSSIREIVANHESTSLVQHLDCIASVILAGLTDPDPEYTDNPSMRESTTNLASRGLSQPIALQRTYESVRPEAIRLGIELLALDQDWDECVDNSETITDIRIAIRERLDDPTVEEAATFGSMCPYAISVQSEDIWDTVLDPDTASRPIFRAGWFSYLYEIHMLSVDAQEPYFLQLETVPDNLSMSIDIVSDCSDPKDIELQILAQTLIDSFVYETPNAETWMRRFLHETPPWTGDAVAGRVVPPEQFKADMWPRVNSLWEIRLETVSDPSAHAQEFGFYCWWLHHEDLTLTLSKVEDLLYQTVQYVRGNRRAWQRIAEFLAENCHYNPDTAVDLIESLVAAHDLPQYLKWDDAINTVCQTAFDHSHEAALKAITVAEIFSQAGDDRAEHFLMRNT